VFEKVLQDGSSSQEEHISCLLESDHFFASIHDGVDHDEERLSKIIE